MCSRRTLGLKFFLLNLAIPNNKSGGSFLILEEPKLINVQLMKEEFFLPHSADQLWKQILDSTQGDNESIGIYVATMTALFERMPTHVSDLFRLQVLRKNIIPFYQEMLALLEVKTPFELIGLCQKLESTRFSVQSFKPPQMNALPSEPDLAFTGQNKQNGNSCVAIREMEARPIERLCCRRNREGHLAYGCTAPTGIKCYRCCEPNYIVKNCPKCAYSYRSKMSGKRNAATELDRVLPANVPSVNQKFCSQFSKQKIMFDYIFSLAGEGVCPYVKVEILGHEFEELLDSGANKTFLNHSGWKILQRLGIKLDKSRMVECRVANGDNCERVGVVTVQNSI
ncbi:hypothetical protein FQA39_LY06818 [Lamprigera yunnana]|nr:hypothetical protein FQA39_LY06818 [Lamprigera yunnana]